MTTIREINKENNIFEPSEYELFLYKKIYNKELFISFKNIIYAKKLFFISHSKTKKIKEIHEYKNVCVIEEKFKKNDKTKLLVQINNEKYRPCNLLGIFACVKCNKEKRINFNPSRDLKKLKSILCEKCFKSTYYREDSYREMYEKTMLKKYKVKHTMNSPIIREKIKNTMMQRYGVPYSGMSEELYKKSVETTKKIYGDNNIFGSSKIEIEFAKKVSKLCEDLKLKSNSALNESFKIKINKMPYVVDFYIPEIKLAIEFFGDFFHGNPKVYDSNMKIGFKGKTRKEINDFDKERLKKIKKELGIKPLVIWEKDWIENEEKQLSKIKNYIMEILNEKV